MRKTNPKMIALPILLFTAIGLLLMRQPRQLAATWEYSYKERGSQFLYPRENGGVAITGSRSKIFWLDAKGQEVTRIDIAPDEFFFPQLHDGRVVSGTKQGYVYAFDDDGKELWKSRPFTGTCSITHSSSGRLGVIKAGPPPQQVAVLDVRGQALSRYSLDGRLSGWPAPVFDTNGRLIGDDTERGSMTFVNADLAAYDNKGKKLWSNRLGGFSVMEVLPGVSDAVYCVAHQNRVFCVDSVTGKTRWSFVSPRSRDPFYQIYSMPENRLLVTDGLGLTCLNDTGNVLWQRNLGGLGSCVVADDGTIYTTTSTTVVPTSILHRWQDYQLNKGNFGAKFPLPTGTKVYLKVITAEGKLKTTRRLDNDLLLECLGPEGELYGNYIEFGFGRKADTHHVRRYDP